MCVCVCVQEARRFQSAFEKKEFRDLFVEYAEEISDPENKKVGVCGVRTA